MGDSPQTYKVTQVQPDGKVWVDGFGSALDLSPKGTTANIGQEVNGWLNPEGKFGPYLKVAEARQSAGSNGGGYKADPQRSARIERQHSQEMALRTIALKFPNGFPTPNDLGEELASWTDWFVADLDNASARTGGTPPPASPAADPPSAGEGANRPASASTTSDLPDF